MTRLSLKDVMDLLGVEAINGTPRQVERFRRWIEIMVEKRGTSFVSENKCRLLDEWDQLLKSKTKSCC
jgi:hypothetical protein